VRAGIELRGNNMLASEMVSRSVGRTEGRRDHIASSPFYLSIYLTALGDTDREREREREREGKEKERRGSGKKNTEKQRVSCGDEPPSSSSALDAKVLPVETLHEHRSALRGVLRTPAGHRRAILGIT